MPVAAIAVTALEAEVAPDLPAADVADDAASDKADRAGDKAACNGTHSRMRRAAGRVSSRTRCDDSGCGKGKSTKRSH